MTSNPFDDLTGMLDEISIKRGEAPAVRECQSQADLAAWLLRFGDACRATLPAPEPS
jgi:hypothetical protein